MLLSGRQMTEAALHHNRLKSLSRSKSNKKCEQLAKTLIEKCKERGITLSYDITYSGKPHELRYTEFMASLGGIIISPCDRDACLRQYDLAMAARINEVDYSEMMADAGDKYILHKYKQKPIEQVAILPGSNILEKTVDKVKLNTAVSKGAKVKLHPLTNKNHCKLFKKEYGVETIVPRTYSGFNTIKGAKVVYTTGTSELGLYAMLMGKKVKNIGTDYPAGGYAYMFSRVIGKPNHKKYLNFLLNSPLSGVVFPGDEDRIDAYLDWHLEHYGNKERT